MKYIKGKKGGTPKPYMPVEDENSLRSNSVARIVDVISEGEIEGFVTPDKDRSIYIDTIPLKGDVLYNFDGITTILKEGIPSQTHIPGFSSESEQAVGSKMWYNVAMTKNIISLTTDEIIITVRVPTLLKYEDNGDIKKTSIKFRIEINSTLVGDKTIYGKCTSEYLKSYKLPPLSDYGAGPWEIKLTRLTADSSSSKLANDIYWNTYTELINEKIPYADTALVGFTADSQQFGGKMPQRLYHVKGIKVKHPSNYDPTTRVYTGSWDGTFTIGYTNNPAWIYYDLLYTDRYGCGFENDIGDGNYFIDKWELYTISQNCDVMVDDGLGGTEPRFTFNSVISTREQAQIILVSLASTFRAKPFWYTGLSTLAQDRPKDPVKVVTNADVINGLFQYSGSSLKDRVTCVNVSWNDPDDFYKPAVEVIEDQDGIVRYGFNTRDISAYGCTSRAQARRFGKWNLYTELRQTTVVEYSASFDHFQLIPGDVIIINDDHYITKKLGGRIKSATTTEIVIDRDVILESGKSYTIAMESPTGELVRADILNSPETTDTLNIANIDLENVPQNWAVFSINSDTFDERQFQIVDMKFNEDNIVNIKALLYDPDKFDAVDTGIYFDEKHYSDIDTGPLATPTGLDAKEYAYVANQSDFVGILLSWEHPEDARINRYEVQWKDTEGAWSNLGQTEQNYYDIRPVDTGDYLLRVRSKSITDISPWSDEFALSVTWNFDAPADVTGLQVVGGGSTFDGKTIEIEWDAYDMTLGKFDKYIVRVYTTADVLLRTLYTAENKYIYTEQMNIEDNGTAQRSIKFHVVVVDIYNNESNTPAVLTATNPVPTMASVMPTTTNLFKGLKVAWSSVSDNDMESYRIYLDKSSPPTTLVGEVGRNTNTWLEVELDSDDVYYTQIEPYDCFGVGVKSQINNGSPLSLPGDGIDIELESTIEMSDSDDSTAGILSKLYDGNKLTDGIEYILSGTDKWIEYKFPVEYIMDNVTAWFDDANANIYVGYKRGESDSWHYLKAEADHTLDDDGRLLDATNLSDAQTNYLDVATITTDTKKALFPQALVATHCRLFFIGTYTTTIYELRFTRQVIAEHIVAAHLDVISESVGTLKAGVIQSSNYDNTHGMIFDLTGNAFRCGGNVDPKLNWDGPNEQLNIKALVEFQSGTTGYTNTDGPQNLSELDSTADDKLDGIEAEATVGADWDTDIDNKPADPLLLNELNCIGGYQGVPLPFSIRPCYVDCYINNNSLNYYWFKVAEFNLDSTYRGCSWNGLFSKGQSDGRFSKQMRARINIQTDGAGAIVNTGFQYSGDDLTDILCLAYEGVVVTVYVHLNNWQSCLFNGVWTFYGSVDKSWIFSDQGYTDNIGTATPVGTFITATSNYDIGADVTGDNTAANITGQGDLAIQDRTDLDYADGATVGADWDTNLTNIPADISFEIIYQSTEPTSNLSIGDYWIDSDDNKLHRYDGSAWVDVQDDDVATAITNAATAQSTANGKVVVYRQTSEPTAEGTGDLWFDSDDGNKVHCWDGSTWVDIQDSDIGTAISNASTAQTTADDAQTDATTGINNAATAQSTADDAQTDATTGINNAATAQSTADGKVVTFYDSTEPTAEGIGDLWIDTDDNKLYRWNNSSWVEIQDDGIATAISNAATAQTTADGKIITFYTDTEPTTGSEGDLWFDTNDNNKQYRYTSSAWAAVPYDVADWAKVFGSNMPDDNADVTNDNTANDTENVGNVSSTDIQGWSYDPDTTKIDGGNMYVGSSIRLDEGGKIHCGDDNILIETDNSVNGHGYIVVADDGGVDINGNIADGKNYLKIESGEIKTYKWFNSAHREFKALAKIKTGTAANGDTVNLGYFPNEPKILLSPYNLQCYNGSYSNQDQSFNLNSINITQNTAGEWEFDVLAQLILSSAGGSATVGFDESNNADGSGNILSTSTVTTPSNTNSVTSYVRVKSVRKSTGSNSFNNRKVYYRMVIGGTNYTWHSLDLPSSINYHSFNFTESIVTAESYTVKVEIYCENRSGTFTASASYQYSTTSSTNSSPGCDTGSQNAYSSNNTTDHEDNTAYFNWPTPVKTTGWDLYKYKYECSFKYKRYTNVTGPYGIAISNTRFKIDKNSSSWDYDEDISTASAGVLGQDNLNLTYNFSKEVNSGSYSAPQGEIEARSDAKGGTGYTASARSQVQLSSLKVTFYLRRYSTADGNNLEWDSYDYQLASVTILADGSVNYMAVDGGE